MSVRPFGEAWCTWSGLSSSATTHHGNLVGDGAEDVKYQVIDDEHHPWADHDEAEYQLHMVSEDVQREGAARRTNIRVSHVSTKEKLVGRIDSNPITSCGELYQRQAIAFQERRQCN
jgi:hypothetical protein